MGSPWKMMVAGGGLAVWTMALSAPAQTASPYTMPDPAAPPTHESRTGPAANDAPRRTADQPDAGDQPSLPPPQASPLQQMVQEKKLWTEMTPAEIMGVAPEKKDKDAKAFDPNHKEGDGTPLQEFFRTKRQEQYGMAGDDSTSDTPGSPGNGASAANGNWLETMAAGSMPAAGAQLFNHLLENARGNNTSHAYSDSDWAGVFQTPAAVQPTAEQQADMAAFQQMLKPGPATDAEKSGSLDGRSFTPQADPNLEPAAAGYNPAGGSFVPLDSGINRPKRLTAMPTATVPSGLQAPSTAPPAWAPQPPPWTITAPQLFVEPTRKF